MTIVLQIENATAKADSITGVKHPSYSLVTAPRAVAQKRSKLTEFMPTVLLWQLMKADDYTV